MSSAPEPASLGTPPEPAAHPVAPSPVLQRSRGRLIAVSFGLILFLGVSAAIGAWLTWPRRPPPEPPVLELADTDPAVREAIEGALAQVRSQPRSARAWGELGMVLLAHRYEPEAVECLAEAERLDPHDAHWPYYAGIAYLSLNGTAAVNRFQRAVELDPNTVALQVRLGEALLAQDRAAEAETWFHHALEKEPGSVAAHMGLARSAHARGNLEECQRQVHFCLDPDGLPQAGHRLLALVYQFQGKTRAAEQELRIAGRLKPDAVPPDPYAYEIGRLQTGHRNMVEHAETLMQAGKTAEAAALLEQVVERYPNNPRGWLLLGRARRVRKDLAGSRKALQRALEIDPNNIESIAQLGLLEHQEGNYAASARSLRKVLALKPDLGAAHYNLGLALAGKGDSAGAIASFRQAIHYQPDLVPAHRALGKQLLEAGQAKQAIPHLRDALSIDPSDEEARKVLNQAAAQLKQKGQP